MSDDLSLASRAIGGTVSPADGNSLIVSPWGEVLARVDEGPGIAIANIDLQSQADIRARFPALTHQIL